MKKNLFHFPQSSVSSITVYQSLTVDLFTLDSNSLKIRRENWKITDSVYLMTLPCYSLIYFNRKISTKNGLHFPSKFNFKLIIQIEIVINNSLSKH